MLKMSIKLNKKYEKSANVWPLYTAQNPPISYLRLNTQKFDQQIIQFGQVIDVEYGKKYFSYYILFRTEIF